MALLECHPRQVIAPVFQRILFKTQPSHEQVPATHGAKKAAVAPPLVVSSP
jgi:hypothetical protein